MYLRKTAKLLLSLTLTIYLSSCAGVDENLSEAPQNDDTSQFDGETPVATGTFQTGTKVTSGEAELFFVAPDNTYTLILRDFSTGNGPNVRVYLSELSGNNAGTPGAFVDIGPLLSTNGAAITFSFPASQFDVNRVYVAIWCAQFPQTFGQALLNL